jgi:hypothetical protein
MAISAVCAIPALVFLVDPLKEIANPKVFDESTVIVAVMHSYHLCAYKCSKAGEQYSMNLWRSRLISNSRLVSPHRLRFCRSQFAGKILAVQHAEFSSPE